MASESNVRFGYVSSEGPRTAIEPGRAGGGLPACTPRLGHPCGCFCFIASLRDHPSYSRLRCSALRHRCLLWPLLTSANASEDLSIPVALDGTFADLPGYCAPIFTLMRVGSTTPCSVHVSGFASVCLLTPRCCLYPLPVRRASALLPASFRLPVTRETVAFR
jgi:hypothetical protein